MAHHIDLHLPTSWNGCTTEELEYIAAAIIAAQMRVDRYHPFDWAKVKAQIVLAVNGISVSEEFRVQGSGLMVNGSGFRVHGSGFHHPSSLSPHPSSLSPQPSDIESKWLVQRPEDKEPWPLSVGQLYALCERLNWIDDEKSDKVIFQFPYPELTLVHGSGLRAQGSKPLTINREPLTVAGPPPLLDGYTWREYRWLTDWMQEYMRIANAMAQSKREDVRRKHAEGALRARNEFLAILFKPAGKPTGTAAAEHTSSLFPLTSDIFTGFSPVKWQVILFWWSSLMQQLSKKFPRVFKSQPIGKGKQPKRDTPWDFYNRVTATIQKYIGGLSAENVDAQPYSVTLQQLEMMADEAAEMDKLKHKK